MRVSVATPFLSEASFALKPGGLIIGRIARGLIDDFPADASAVTTLLGDAREGVTIDKIAIGAGSSFRFSRETGECLTLSLSRGRGEIGATVAGRSVQFVVEGDPRGGSDVVMCPTEPVRLAVFGVTSFDFDRRFEASASQHYSMSTLSDVDLSFPQLGLKREVSSLAGLRVAGVSASEPLVIDLNLGGELGILLAGNVEQIVSGPGEYPKNLLPLLLEHFLGSSPIAQALTGFGFFWGLLWSVFRFARPLASLR